MAILTDAEIERIVAQYHARKLTADMLDAAAAIDRMLRYRQPEGLATPWPYLHERFALRPGELTLIAGANGSGKSMIAGQMVAWAMAAGATCVIASMEMAPHETLRRMVQQCAGGGFTAQYAHWWGQTYREKLWVWDVQDVIPADKVLDRVEAVAQHLKANIVVVDSLLKCGLPQDGNGHLTGQTAFLDRLQHAAKHLGVHILLVVHLRKPERGAKSTKYDIRGASQISDLADNVLLMHRNEAKREAEQLQEQGETLTLSQLEQLAKADAALEVAKQRHGAWEGSLRLDFHRGSLQYRQANWTSRYEWPGNTGAPR